MDRYDILLSLNIYGVEIIQIAHSHVDADIPSWWISFGLRILLETWKYPAHKLINKNVLSIFCFY